MAKENDRIVDYPERLRSLLKGYRRLIILGHDNPDPDFLASGMALKYIAKTAAGIPAIITYGGVLGRAENRAMVRLLAIHLTPLPQVNFSRTAAVALLDTQPGTGNNSLPGNVVPQIVIDHHPRLSALAAPFVDIRSGYGTTSTILTEYLRQLGGEIPSSLATALTYGIISETMDLSRETGESDIRAYISNLAAANKRYLAQIIHPKLSRYYFTTIGRALNSAFYYRNIIASRLGEVQQPDVIAQVADFLISHERMSWSLCSGFHDDQLLVSVRSNSSHANLGRLMRNLVARRGTAGGHELSAGAQLDCHGLVPAERLRLEEIFILDFIRRITHHKEIEPKPLIPRP